MDPSWGQEHHRVSVGPGLVGARLICGQPICGFGGCPQISPSSYSVDSRVSQGYPGLDRVSYTFREYFAFHNMCYLLLTRVVCQYIYLTY